MDSFSCFPFAAIFWIASHEPRIGVNFELLLGALGLIVGQLLERLRALRGVLGDGVRRG